MDSITDNSGNGSSTENMVDDIIANNDSVLRQKNIDSVLKSAPDSDILKTTEAQTSSPKPNGIKITEKVDSVPASTKSETDSRIDEYVNAAKSSHSPGVENENQASSGQNGPQPFKKSSVDNAAIKKPDGLSKKTEIKKDPFVDDTEEDVVSSAHGMYGRRSPSVQKNKFKKADNKEEDIQSAGGIFGGDNLMNAHEEKPVAEDVRNSFGDSETSKSFGMFGSKKEKNHKKDKKDKSSLEWGTGSKAAGSSDSFVFDDAKSEDNSSNDYLKLDGNKDLNPETEMSRDSPDNWPNQPGDLGDDNRVKSGGLLSSFLTKREKKDKYAEKKKNKIKEDGFDVKAKRSKSKLDSKPVHISLDSPKDTVKKRDWVLYAAISLIVLTVVSWAGAMYLFFRY